MLKESISSKNLIKHVHNLMEKGKKSRVKGWSMNDILEDVYDSWGQGARDFAFKYIKEDYCGIKDDN